MVPLGDFDSTSCLRVAVIGGGAAGFFAAISTAELNPSAEVVLFESGKKVLRKVKVSGGGRCNVTHACFQPREFAEFYPRGSRQLIGPLHRWGASETMEWFESRGVPLKIEADNRVFPQSDQSQTIIDCLMQAARKAGVDILTSTAVKEASLHPGGFVVVLGDGRRVVAANLLLTTGGARDPVGAKIARGFGHRIETAAPSLFTFKIRDPRRKAAIMSIKKTFDPKRNYLGKRILVGESSYIFAVKDLPISKPFDRRFDAKRREERAAIEE